MHVAVRQCCRAPFSFFFPVGSQSCHRVRKKKTARNYENYRAAVFWEVKNPELSKPCLLILHPSASASPPYVPPYFHRFCSVQASPGVSSGTPVRLRPLLRSTSSLWLESGSAARPGAACSPPGQLGCLMVPFIRLVVMVEGTGGGVDVGLVVDFIGSVIK